MGSRNPLTATHPADLPGRVANFCGSRAAALEDLDVEVAPAVSPSRERGAASRWIADLKLLFAALAAGGRAVPLGDNGRTARLLSNYAASLRDR